MKLARKLAGALILAMCVVLVIGGFVRARVVLSLFDSDADREHRVVGRAVAETVSEMWAVHDLEGAHAVVRRASDEAAGMQVHWVTLGGRPFGLDAPLAPPDVFEALSREEKSWLTHDAQGNDRLVTYVAVPTDTGIATSIEIADARVPRREYLRSSYWATAATTLAALIVCGAIAALIGLWLVGRPVDRLVAHARRIAEGDFAARLDVQQNDEIGLLSTEMNAMAAALHRAQNRLETETSARIAALEQLRQADRLLTVGRLASGIAHELGTPLNVVSGRAQQIAAEETTAGETVEYAQIIVDEAERMTTIIRQLLDFARHREPDKARQDLGPIVETTMSLLSSLADKRGVELRVVPAKAKIEAFVDAGQMQQVLTNLIVNAIHASARPGEVVVSSGERDAEAPSELGNKAKRWLFIDVEDRGSGIADEHLARIFEPFFTTKDVGEGTGLGLSVSWGIVREHGGFIDVESKVGRGSRFTVYLPKTES